MMALIILHRGTYSRSECHCPILWFHRYHRPIVPALRFCCHRFVADIEAKMVKLLAKFFRTIHYMIGISLPRPTTSDRTFVFVWLFSIAVIGAFCVLMFVYLIPFLVFRD